MFSITSLIGLISSAPSIIQGTMTLITEIESGYAKGKAAGGDPVVVFENILAELVANKGAVASAVLGPEPTVSTSGVPVDPSAKKV